MTFSDPALPGFGWAQDFLAQVALDELACLVPVRVAAVHRAALAVIGAGGPSRLTLPPGLPAGAVAVGDWLLADPARGRAVRVLARRSLIARRAAGRAGALQPVAANVDALLVVTACGGEFREARLERYLALARAAGVEPVVVLTKADLVAAPPGLALRARGVAGGAAVLALDARDAAAAAAALAPWTGRGRTLALAGSSGVGKTTLANALTGRRDATAPLSADGARGRHTTSARALRPLAAGGWLIDTPGLREVGLADAAAGIAATFGEIAAAAGRCRFRDCTHTVEPGCAVLAAAAAGAIAPDRIDRARRLAHEDRRETATLAAARAGDRRRGRHVARLLRLKRDLDGGD
ncbi:MAG: ribosome small subunit-dependent GTPase A [Rhodobacteraceae bacterium]|nr:ribosome small subunit-dependent GTPase A [Paracoccaceae bacterium]